MSATGVDASSLRTRLSSSASAASSAAETCSPALGGREAGCRASCWGPASGSVELGPGFDSPPPGVHRPLTLVSFHLCGGLRSSRQNKREVGPPLGGLPPDQQARWFGSVLGGPLGPPMADASRIRHLRVQC